MNPPWLAETTAKLRGARHARRLPTALLLHEAPGAGGELLAQFFAQLVLCPDAASGGACGLCSTCQRVARREHPDFREVRPDPEMKSGQISVDQIREISAALALSSYEGQGTCIVIAPAEAMTRAASNALLKTLEEPRSGAHLLLLTTQPSRLPATIRSRCQLLRLPAPSRPEALEWLQQQKPAREADWEAALDVLGMAPLEAIAQDPVALRAIRDEAREVLLQAAGGRLDIVRVADRWHRDELPLRLRAIENCLTRCALDSGADGGESAEMRPGTHLSEGHPDINIASALKLLDEVRELRLLLTTSLNKPLALERHLWRLNGVAAAS